MTNEKSGGERESKSFATTSAEFRQAVVADTEKALLLCDQAQLLLKDIAQARQEVIRELGRTGPKLVQPD